MGKYENLHCRFVTLGASGGTALKINESTKDMTTGSLEPFGKPPSVNTVCLCSYKFRSGLLYINQLGPSWKWKGVPWSDESKFQIFGSEWMMCPLAEKRKAKPLWMVACWRPWRLNCDSAIDAQRKLLFHGCPCFALQDSSKRHSARLTTAQLRVKECRHQPGPDDTISEWTHI